MLQLRPVEFLKEIVILFNAFHRPEMLAASPLLGCQWIVRSMVSGEYADIREQARTLQAALKWVVEQLAPDSPEHGFGTIRPLDDPTWTDPAWWSYNLLRHRYIEPIFPDDYFEDTRLTGTLIALTGISGRSAYYTELKRALTRAGAVIRDEMSEPRSSRIIQRRLLAGMQDELSRFPGASAVLGIASVFFRAFPRRLLQEMAETESVSGSFQAIEYLLTDCCLLELDDRTHLLLPPVLREYIDARQSAAVLKIRHAIAAKHAQESGQVSDWIHHLQHSGDQSAACRLLLDNWGTLGSRCSFDELIEILDGFPPGSLSVEDRIQVLICKGSHLIRFGHFEQARELFLDMRHHAETAEFRQLSLIFLGHVCGNIDPESASRYFAAAEAESVDDSLFARFLYSSMGRFHLSRNEIDKAESYLLRALAAPEHHLLKFTSVLLFALTDLYLLKGETEKALKFAGDLVTYAESERDAHLSALALGTLGKVHMERGAWDQALRYLGQSETLHRKRFNLNEIARIRVFVGMIHHRSGCLEEATIAFEDALECYERLGIGSKERVNVHMELAQLYAERSLAAEARMHWKAASRQAGQLGLHKAMFDQLNRLRDTLPALQDLPKSGQLPSSGTDPLQKTALELAARAGWVTSGDLIVAAGIGRTKAFSVLSNLAAAGRLVKSGRGRATRYMPMNDTTGTGGAGIHYLTEAVMEQVRKIGFITSSILERKADVSRATAKRALAAMVKAGVLIHLGKGRSRRYGVSSQESGVRSQYKLL